jgi:hypothetical protein
MLYRQFKTQEELDDECRPEARITDPTAFDKLIEKRRTLSASAKAELTRKADLRYGPTLIERLDVYPAAEPNAPIVIFIHGGYWFDARLTKDMYVWVAKGFVGHGVTTVIVDYEVCPKRRSTRSCGNAAQPCPSSIAMPRISTATDRASTSPAIRPTAISRASQIPAV